MRRKLTPSRGGLASSGSRSPQARETQAPPEARETQAPPEALETHAPVESESGRQPYRALLIRAQSPETEVKRRRGRPRKNKDREATGSPGMQAPQELEAGSTLLIRAQSPEMEVRRRRGRPRKNNGGEATGSSETNAPLGLEAGSTLLIRGQSPVTEVRRRRGRPRKNNGCEATGSRETHASPDTGSTVLIRAQSSRVEVRRRRGRPRKNTDREATGSREPHLTEQEPPQQHGQPQSQPEGSAPETPVQPEGLELDPVPDNPGFGAEISSDGRPLIPHFIRVKPGGEVVANIWRFAEAMMTGLIIISGLGTVSLAVMPENVSNPVHVGCFQITSLSGSIVPGEPTGRTGDIMVTLSDRTGTTIGGIVQSLFAESHVQVIVSCVSRDVARPFAVDPQTTQPADNQSDQ